MATITKRNGTYRIRVSLGYDENNKQIIKATTFIPTETNAKKIEREVKTFAQQFEDKCLGGSLPVDDKITFEEFARIWEKNWLPAKTPTVQDNYKDVLRIRINPFIGNYKLTKINATHIDDIINCEKNEGKAPKTIRMTFTVINSVLRYALKKRYINENPCTRCDDLPKIKMKTGNELQFFTIEQTKIFLYTALIMDYSSNIKSHKRKVKKTNTTYIVSNYTEKHNISLQWRVYFFIAIFGGLRRGEVCALTWEDIDFSKHVIKINKAFANTKNGQILKAPKTDSAIRDLTLPDFCFDMLAELKKEQLQKVLLMGTAWNGHRNNEEDNYNQNYVFTQYDGQPVNLSTPSHKFKEIIDMYNSTCEKEKDKLPNIRLHDLRHTNATLLLSQNTDIETVSRRLGHSKTSVTLDIYGHALPENDEKASLALKKMFI